MPTALSSQEIEERLAALPGWRHVDKKLSKTFRFDSYVGGLDFVVAVAGLAERLNHHPDILLTWRKVGLTIHTHTLGAVSELDVAFAKGVESLT